MLGIATFALIRHAILSTQDTPVLFPDGTGKHPCVFILCNFPFVVLNNFIRFLFGMVMSSSAHCAVEVTVPVGTPVISRLFLCPRKSSDTSATQSAKGSVWDSRCLYLSSPLKVSMSYSYWAHCSILQVMELFTSNVLKKDKISFCSHETEIPLY